MVNETNLPPALSNSAVPHPHPHTRHFTPYPKSNMSAIAARPTLPAMTERTVPVLRVQQKMKTLTYWLGASFLSTADAWSAMALSRPESSLVDDELDEAQEHWYRDHRDHHSLP